MNNKFNMKKIFIVYRWSSDYYGEWGHKENIASFETEEDAKKHVEKIEKKIIERNYGEEWGVEELELYNNGEKCDRTLPF